MDGDNAPLRFRGESDKDREVVLDDEARQNFRHIQLPVGVLDEFMIVIGGIDVVLDKLNPEILLNAAHEHGLTSEDSIVVEYAH